MQLKQTQRLLSIMAQLRDKHHGCPWDIEQDFGSIAPYTIEEAYEVADAIRNKDMAGLKDELGDLLLQVVFHAQMGKEEGLFDFEQVAEAICDKMEQRHPHVFGDAAIATADAQTASWEAIKAEERKKKAKGSVLDDVPLALPALLRAEKLQKRAARVGFDWPTLRPVFTKLYEELTELQDALDEGAKPDRLADELGDLLFVIANIARHCKVDPEDALRGTNHKFEQRFHYIEKTLAAQGKQLTDATLEEMDALWNEAKRKEKKAHAA